jgi:hypothetical protein
MLALRIRVLPYNRRTFPIGTALLAKRLNLKSSLIDLMQQFYPELV